MDVTSNYDITEGGANKTQIQSEHISSQPAANGSLRHQHSEEVPAPFCERSEDGDNGDESLTDACSTNDVFRLLSAQPTSRQKQKDVETSSVAAPICAPPSSSTSHCRPPLQSSACSGHHHHHHSTNQKRLSSTRNHAPSKADAAHIKEVAGDDCCIHCLLACLYCEMLSMCSALGECLVCGVGGGGGCDDASGCCCCCVEAAGEAACGEEACQAVLDCGILEDCCGSSDCMEICLECCSICFPT